MTEHVPTGICRFPGCGARVPLDLLAEHLAEHHDITAQEMRDAPVIDQTGEDDE